MKPEHTGQEAKVLEQLFNKSHIDKKSLLLEVNAALSLWLQDRYKDQDVQFTIQGKNLDLEETFGVRGLLPDAYRICGLSRYWGNAGEGTVANIFAAHDIANPVFLLDEIDKTKKDERSDPLSVILLLLEKESSRGFKDSFVDIPIDVSHASFIATANDISELPEPLLSRFHCIEVQPLDYEGRCTMVRTSYQELLAQEGLAGFLEQSIHQSTMDALAGCDALTGRELKREILLSMQRACREFKLGQARKSIHLLPAHLRLPDDKPNRSIGFY